MIDILTDNRYDDLLADLRAWAKGDLALSGAIHLLSSATFSGRTLLQQETFTTRCVIARSYSTGGGQMIDWGAVGALADSGLPSNGETALMRAAASLAGSGRDVALRDLALSLDLANLSAVLLALALVPENGCMATAYTTAHRHVAAKADHWYPGIDGETWGRDHWRPIPNPVAV